MMGRRIAGWVNYRMLPTVLILPDIVAVCQGRGAGVFVLSLVANNCGKTGEKTA